MKETVAMLNQQYVMPEGLAPYAGVTAQSPWLASESEKRQRKICASLEEAIRRSGLQNGMTISFHHAFAAATRWSIWWWRSWLKWGFAI
jgi:citrate lyase subunit alpha/citrate CoA-transferase